MKVLFIFLLCISMNILSCPTRLAHDLLSEEEICFKDVNKHSVDK